MTLALLAVLIGLQGCSWLDERQRRVALRPSATPTDAEALMRWRPGDERWLAPANGMPGQQLAIWWLPHAQADAPTLLYLHGTLRTLYGNAPKIEVLREAGFSILAVDYRGWGDSTALVPSEATILADARQAWAELQRRQPVPGRRVIFGHSMGSAVAVILASSLRHGQDYGALALEAAFTRMPDVAAEAGFWGRLGAAITTLDFNAIGRIPQVDAPTWMLHGDADNTVPISLGRRLRDAARPGVHWVEFSGGTHSRLHQEHKARYLQAFAELQQSLAPVLPVVSPPPASNPVNPNKPSP